MTETQTSSPRMAKQATAPRRYRSPLRASRALDTRRAVLAAAHALFTTNGWAATGMRDVAAAAGVATETVYAHFASKRALLEGVIDIAVAGDDRPLAIAARPEFVAIGRGPRAHRVMAAAQLLAGIYGRTAGITNVVREAAAGDADMAEILRATRERQRRDVATAAELIIGEAPTPTERDGLWALTSPDVYLLLVEHTGWTSDQYVSWMAETLDRVVPHRQPRRSRR